MISHQSPLRNMIDIKQSGEELLFSVRVQPKASANKILGEHAGALKVAVTAPPEKGKANAAVVALLSEALGVPKSAVEIVRGRTSRTKTLRIKGLTKEILSQLLARAAKAGPKSEI